MGHGGTGCTRAGIASAGSWEVPAPLLSSLMAMTTCRECGQQVSDTAATCPHCGVRHPDPAQARRSVGGDVAKVVLLVGVVLAVVYVLAEYVFYV